MQLDLESIGSYTLGFSDNQFWLGYTSTQVQSTDFKSKCQLVNCKFLLRLATTNLTQLSRTCFAVLVYI